MRPPQGTASWGHADAVRSRKAMPSFLARAVMFTDSQPYASVR